MKEVKERKQRRWQNKPRERVRFEESAAAPASPTDAVDVWCTPAKRTRRREFYDVRKDVDKFGQSKLPTMMCRNRFKKLLMDGEIRLGGAALSSFATVEMDAQTKKRQRVISPEQTEVRIVVPPEVPHDTRICIEDFVDMDIDQLKEKRKVREATRRTEDNPQKQSLEENILYPSFEHV